MNTDGFFNLDSLSPDVGNQARVTIAADGVLETGGQLGLAEWNMFTTSIRQSHHNLLEETQRLVDVHRFLFSPALRLQPRSNIYI